MILVGKWLWALRTLARVGIDNAPAYCYPSYSSYTYPRYRSYSGYGYRSYGYRSYHPRVGFSFSYCR